MSSEELSKALSQVSELVHAIYKESDGPRLLNEIFAEHPPRRMLRGVNDVMSHSPTTKVIG